MRNTIKNTLLLLEMTYRAKGFSVSDKGQSVMTMMIDTWTGALQDLPEKAVETAVTAWIQTHEWPPTPADIRNLVMNSGTENPVTAWSKVTEAISKYGMNRAQEALETLDQTTRDVVQAMGWRNLCTSENVAVDRAHFIRLYEPIHKREKELRMMSAPVRDAIEKIGGGVNDGKRLLGESD